MQQDVLLCHANVAKAYQARNGYPAANAQFRLAVSARLTIAEIAIYAPLRAADDWPSLNQVRRHRHYLDVI